MLRIKLVPSPGAFASQFTTNLASLPFEICDKVYDADILSAADVVCDKYFVAMLAKATARDEKNRPLEACCNIYVLEPLLEEKEVILGASLIFDRDTSSIEMHVERTIQYTILDTYQYHVNLKGDSAAAKNYITEQFKKVLAGITSYLEKRLEAENLEKRLGGN